MSRTTHLIGVSALACAAMLTAESAYAQTATSGAIQGVVTDKATGAPMMLVVVVATSPSLQGQLSEFTDESGNYVLSNLPPGIYTLDFVSDAGGKVRRENVQVGLGKVVKVNAKLEIGGEVIVIKTKAPSIDSGSTKQGTTLEQDYLTKVPQRGRTYAQAIGAAAGSQGDQYGVSFSGSTSIENNYVVDGVNTTGLSFGQVGSPLLNNFIQEIEVITGGYNAEFGRATGGVVNVVTKTGSNEFHGSVWGQFVPFEATRKTTPAEGSAIVAENNLDQDFDVGFELGGPIIKDRLWFYVGFAPTVLQRKIDRVVQTQVDRRNNFFDYSAAGCAQNSDGTCDGDGDPATTGANGCELSGNCEGDGAADEDANGFSAFEEIDRTRLNPNTTTYQFLGKLNFAVSPDHAGQVALNGNYARIDNFGVFGTPTATQTDQIDLTTDLSAKWTSRFNDNKTQVDAVLGWHRYQSNAAPKFDVIPGSPDRRVSDTSNSQLVENATTPTLGQIGRNPDTFESPEVLQFCTDGGPDDQFPTIDNCPVPLYAWNSPVGDVDTGESRYSAKLTLTQRVKLAGHHQFKVGGDYEANTLDSLRQYNGGAFNQGFNLGSGGGIWRIWRFIDPSETGDACTLTGGDPLDCKYVDKLNVHGVMNNWSAFAQDSWSILPNLTLNAGLRYEEQRMQWADHLQGTIDPITGESVGKNALSLTGLFAPRIGVIYDWTQEGRSKVYANYGRYYESIPMDINNRSFGGEAQYRSTWFAEGANNQCGARPMGDNAPDLATLPENCPTAAQTDPRSGIVLGAGDPAIGTPDGLTLVMPGTKAQYMDELAAGVEYEVMEDLRVGLAYQNRRLGRVIEDMSTDGGTTYFLGNPGEFSSGEEDKLVDQINSMPEDSDVRAALEKRLSLFRAVRNFDKPTRDYHALQLTAVKRFSKAFMMQGSYTYSKLRGNFPGLFSADTGQLDPNISSQYDLQELLGNRFGALPGDRPHQFKVDGYYTFDLGAAGRLTTGLRLRGQSGVPISYLASHIDYGAGETQLLQRGSGGRTPFTFGSDLQLSYARRIGKMDLEVYIQLLDLLNLQGTTAVDEAYTAAFASPVIGGDEGDLPYVKATDDGTNIQRRRNYGNPAARQQPLYTRVGATLSF